MSTAAISLPDDLSISHEIILQQHNQLLASQRKIEQLEHRLDLLLRRIYGPRSERLLARTSCRCSRPQSKTRRRQMLPLRR
jgi:hypothetical protein